MFPRRLFHRFRIRRLRRSRVSGLLLAVVLLAASGLVVQKVPGEDYPNIQSAEAAVQTGSSSWEIDVDGQTRTFHLYVPESLSTADPAPLIVMLHGGFGTGTQAKKAYGWDAMADAEGFIVAYPDGLNRAWNAGNGCCGKSARNEVDEIAFMTVMIDAIDQEISLDRAKIYATGMSNGAILDYRLACETDIFAAIGPNAGTMLVPCETPYQASVIHVHGTNDPMVPYDGGMGSGVANIDGPAIEDLNATWREINGCQEPVITIDVVVTTSIAECVDGRVVELITIEGAGHNWPGAALRPVVELLRQKEAASQAVNATQVIWDFFETRSKL